VRQQHLFEPEPAPGLVGIARMAAEAAVREAKREVTYFELPARRLINRCDSPRVPFRWTINPYRGCELGCVYCYARYTHEFMERDPAAFEELIYAKLWNERSFRRELARVPQEDAIAIGTATDPYQPAERRYGITRGMLEVFRGERGRKLGLTTKSDLVARDAALLREIARENRTSVHVTITTLDATLARRIEPRAPRPDLRLAAVAALARAGVRVGVSASPILPLINDSEETLDGLARAAAAAGARSLWGQTVFLRQPSLDVFLGFLRREFPHLEGRYRERFSRGAYLKGEYPKAIAERLRRARERYGLR
jgi:DNA repair photolyase